VSLHPRTKLNLALLAAVFALAVIALYRPGLEHPAPPPTLTALKPDAVHRITLERRGAGRIVLVRDEHGHWSLRAPITAPASRFQVDAILRLAKMQSARREPIKTVDPAALGLAKPAVTVSLNDTPIAFGKRAPLGNRRYVRVGDTVHLIPDITYYHLVGAYPTFVDRRLLPEGAHITSLTLPGIALTRHDGHWRLKPRPQHYSADAPNRLAEAWRGARAVAISAHDAPMKGDEVRVGLDGAPKPIRFVVLQRQPDLILGRPALGLTYRLPAGAADSLLHLPQSQGE
jgi:hypothetical protein